MSLWQALLLAIVEGITEYLPISSTGHMIIAAALCGVPTDDFYRLYIVSIQLGAILSVVVLYFQRFFRGLDFYYKLFVGFLPAVAVGLLIKKYVDMLLERVDVVAVTLLVGGIVLLFVDRWFAKNEETSMTGRTRGNTISYRSALVIGFFQCIAMVPGVSRSAATIIGGLTQGLNRKAAAEFSFFLAVPTMFAATVKSLWDEKEVLAQHSDAWTTLLIGNVVAFLVAMAAIRFFIGFLTRYGFVLFGWYRIVLGLVLLILLGMGIELKIAD